MPKNLGGYVTLVTAPFRNIFKRVMSGLSLETNTSHVKSIAALTVLNQNNTE